MLRTIFGRRRETEGRGESGGQFGDVPSSAARLAAKKCEGIIGPTYLQLMNRLQSNDETARTTNTVGVHHVIGHEADL